jgi:hypothetical protein
MKKLLWFLGGIAAVLALALGGVLVLGAQQPVAHTASSRATYLRPLEEVWARVADFPTWHEWNGAFTRVVREGDRDGKPCWRFEGAFGPMPMVVEASEPPERLVTRIPVDADLGFSGTWTYAFEPTAAGGTRLTITEDGRVESLLMRGFGALFLGPHDSMNALLVDLGESFGEPIEPEELDG